MTVTKPVRLAAFLLNINVICNVNDLNMEEISHNQVLVWSRVHSSIRSHYLLLSPKL